MNYVFQSLSHNYRCCRCKEISCIIQKFKQLILAHIVCVVCRLSGRDHALDCAATGIGRHIIYVSLIVNYKVVQI